MDTYIIPAEGRFIALAGRSRQGKLFRKEILRVGEWVHPQDPTKKLEVTTDKLDTMVKNFDDRVCDIVQMPLAAANNAHSEDPDRNKGEIIGLEREGDALFATCDARVDADKFGSTYLGISAMYAEDYKDKKSGKFVGPTLLHGCITNRPYITDLGAFEEITAATADLDTEPVLLSRTKKEPIVPKSTLADLKRQLKEDHDIDLDDLQEAAEATDELIDEAVRQVMAEADDDAPDEEVTPEVRAALSLLAEKGYISLSETEPTTQTEILAAGITQLSQRLSLRELESATERVERLIATGFIEPGKKKGMIALCQSDPATFALVLPSKPLVKLAESGVSPTGEPAGASTTDGVITLTEDEKKAAIDRYTALSADMGYTHKEGN